MIAPVASEQVDVDLQDARDLALRLVDRDAVTSDADIGDKTVSVLSVELVPDWYDDESVLQAEAWQQLRLQALEALVERLMAGGRYIDAARAALAAVEVDPLRQTAHATLIRIYLAAGNRVEAHAVFERYRLLLHAQLGLEPTHQLQEIKELQYGLTARLSGV